MPLEESRGGGREQAPAIGGEKQNNGGAGLSGAMGTWPQGIRNEWARRGRRTQARGKKTLQQKKN